MLRARRLGAGYRAPGGDRPRRQWHGLPGVAMAGSVLAVFAACSYTERASTPEFSDDQLVAALLTTDDLGEEYIQRARGVGPTSRGTGGGILFHDPGCQALSDPPGVDAADPLPNVAAIFFVEEPVASLVEDITVVDSEEALTQTQAALDCYRLGFRLALDPEGGDPAGPEATDWVATAVDLTVPGWQTIAYRVQPTSGEPLGESFVAVAGRDSLLVQLNIDGESVPDDMIQTVTTTALRRVDSVLSG